MAIKKNVQTRIMAGLKSRLTPAQQIGLAVTIHPFLADTVVMHSIVGHSDDAAKAAADAKRARRAARNLKQVK